MKYLLDTNIYFAALHDAGFLEHYRATFLRIAPRTYLSSVVRFELLRGARGALDRARVARATRTLERVGRVVVPLHRDWHEAGVVQGRIWDDHPSLRTKDLQNDILIAASARRIGALVVTDNMQDFALIGRFLAHRARRLAEIAGEEEG